MKKKLILALTLSLSLFAVACGGKKESGPAANSAVSSAADSSAAANSEAGSESGATAASGAADGSQAATPAPDAAMATAFRALPGRRHCRQECEGDHGRLQSAETRDEL